MYSPHTALDSAPGGLGDWLADIVTGTKTVRDGSDADGQSEATSNTNADDDDPFVEKKKRPTFTLQHHRAEIPRLA